MLSKKKFWKKIFDERIFEFFEEFFSWKWCGNGTKYESISCQNEHLYKSEFISPNLRLSILGPLFQLDCDLLIKSLKSTSLWLERKAMKTYAERKGI